MTSKTLTHTEIEAMVKNYTSASRLAVDCYNKGYRNANRETATDMAILQDKISAAITRAEAAEKARDEWCEVSQKNYQLARDMEKRLIDILYS